MGSLGTLIKENYYYSRLEIKISECNLLQYIVLLSMVNCIFNNSNGLFMIKLNFIVASIP